MKKLLLGLMRSLKQKEFLKQIFKFLDSPSCPKAYRGIHEEWLLELVDISKAKNTHDVTCEDLREFTNFVCEKESSQYARKEASDVIKRYLKFSKKEGFIHDYPGENLQSDDKDSKMEIMKNIIKRPTRIPDLAMIQLVRKIYNEGNQNNKRMSFQEVADELSKKFHRNFQRQNVWRWYRSSRV